TRSRLTAEVGGSKHVVASDLVRAAHFLHSRNRTERNNATRIISSLKQANVVGTETKLGIGLSGDAISAAEQREIVHVCRSKISLERAEDVAQRHVHALRFDAIHVKPELRHVGAKGRQVIRQAGSLIRFYHHSESLRLQFLEAGVACAILEILSTTACVRSSEDASGNCAKTPA